MFLKRFKEKSIQKYINNILKKRKANVSDGRMESVGIILSQEEYNEHENLTSFFKDHGLRENKIKFITFIEEERNKPNTWDAYFSTKDIGWKGKLINVELEEFVKARFDVLISYYRNDNLILNTATALSNANFKIGISNKDVRLNDIIIDIKTSQIDLFKKEFLKYLKTLNKI